MGRDKPSERWLVRPGSVMTCYPRLEEQQRGVAVAKEAKQQTERHDGVHDDGEWSRLACRSRAGRRCVNYRPGWCEIIYSQWTMVIMRLLSDWGWEGVWLRFASLGGIVGVPCLARLRADAEAVCLFEKDRQSSTLAPCSPYCCCCSAEFHCIAGPARAEGNTNVRVSLPPHVRRGVERLVCG